LTPRQVLGLVVAAAAVGAIAVSVGVYALRPTLAIANVTGADGLTVTLDGKPVAEGLPTARAEGDGAFITLRVKRGEHELVARDAHGVELDRRRFVMSDKMGAALYAPARAPAACFFLEALTYAKWQSLAGYEVIRLDPAESLHPFPRRVDHWFESAPRTIEGSNQSQTEARRAVRAWPCSTDTTGLR